VTDQVAEKAWYTGAARADVGKAAILAGNPARVDRIALKMTDVHRVPENRGLKTITGNYRGKRITVSAFGMGAPIATIVLHELFVVGVRTFLRIGTAMAVKPAKLGDFVLAEGALRAEGTSNTYAPLGYPAVADFELNQSLRSVLSTGGRTWHSGIFGSYDGFYTEMFGISDGSRRLIQKLKDDIVRMGLIGTDMETSALLVSGRILGARVGCLCVATVDAVAQTKIPDNQMAVAEDEMFDIALQGIARFA
jgi:uridine phosphorylase